MSSTRPSPPKVEKDVLHDDNNPLQTSPPAGVRAPKRSPPVPKDLNSDGTFARAWSWIVNMPKLTNPGKFEHMFKEKTDILDARENFDGFHADFTREVSRNFQLTHLINFGSTIEPPGYSLQATYATKMASMSGRWYPSTGVVQGRGVMQKKLTNGRALVFRATGKATKQPGQSTATAEVDIKLKDCTAQFVWHHPGTFEASYIQNVTSTFAAGILGYHDRSMGRSGYTFGFRKMFTDVPYPSVWSGSFSPFNQVALSYTQKSAGDRKQWITEMQFVKPEGQDSWTPVYSAGFQYGLVSSLVKGRIDSNYKCSVLLEERINQAASVLLCGDMDYGKDAYKIGFGFSMRL